MPSFEQIRFRYLRYVVAPMLRLAGPRVTVAIARRLARGIYAMNPPGRAVARARIASAIQLGLFERSSVADVDALTADSYEHLGRFWAEALFIPKRLSESRWRRYVRIENEAAVERFAQDSRGRLVAVAYHGNIAAAACVLGHFCKPVHVVVDTLQVPGLAPWQKSLFSQPDVCVIERREAADRVPEVLERGGVVMLVAEHARANGRGVAVSFMGRTFGAYPTIGVLSQRYGAPVGVLTCSRDDAAFGFTLSLDDVIEPRGVEGRTDDMVRRVLSALERGVMRVPKQYLWSQFDSSRQSGAKSEAVGEGRVLSSRSMPAAVVRAAGRDNSQSTVQALTTDTETESALFPRRD